MSRAEQGGLEGYNKKAENERKTKEVERTRVHSTFGRMKEKKEGGGGRRRKGESVKGSESVRESEWKERKRRRRRWEELGRSDHHFVS